MGKQKAKSKLIQLQEFVAGLNTHAESPLLQGMFGVESGGHIVTLEEFLHLLNLASPRRDEAEFRRLREGGLNVVSGLVEHERLEPDAETAALRWLIGLLDDPDIIIREGAIWALGTMGRKARMALPKLLSHQSTCRAVAIADILGEDEAMMKAIRRLARQDEARLGRESRKGFEVTLPE